MYIRPYSHEDFEMITSWWEAAGECPPVRGMMVEDGTFIMTLDNIPALTVTVFLTQSKEMAYAEGFIKNPIFNHMELEDEAQHLANHAYAYARDRGYSRLIAYCNNKKLTEKYIRLGLQLSAENLFSVVRKLG